MNNDFSIRHYQPADREQVLTLIRFNTPQYFSPDEEADLVDYLDNKIEQYFVIEVEGKIVGCGGINFNDGGSTGVISWDMLHPEYQGKSLGSALLKHRLDKLKEMEQVKRIIVRTSQLTHRFYEKGGFKLVEIVEDYWANGYHLYKMEYAL